MVSKNDYCIKCHVPKFIAEGEALLQQPPSIGGNGRSQESEKPERKQEEKKGREKGIIDRRGGKGNGRTRTREPHRRESDKAQTGCLKCGELIRDPWFPKIWRVNHSQYWTFVPEVT